MKKKNISTNIFASISLFFGLVGLTLSFLPIRMFALIPAGIGIYFGLIAYILSRVFNIKKNFVYIVLSISVLSIVIAGVSEKAFGNKIAKDKQFEQQIETTTEEDSSDFSEAFDDDGDNEVSKDSTATQSGEEFKEEKSGN